MAPGTTMPKGTPINVILNTATIDIDFGYGETVEGDTFVIVKEVKDLKYQDKIKPNDIVLSLSNLSVSKRTTISLVEDIQTAYEFYRNINISNAGVLMKLRRPREVKKRKRSERKSKKNVLREKNLKTVTTVTMMQIQRELDVNEVAMAKKKVDDNDKKAAAAARAAAMAKKKADDDRKAKKKADDRKAELKCTLQVMAVNKEHQGTVEWRRELMYLTPILHLSFTEDIKLTHIKYDDNNKAEKNWFNSAKEKKKKI
ncbi:MAG: hypothetical protein ACI90V_007674 [Bacillariaceae sp.]|jgi:hypothetical protein